MKCPYCGDSVSSKVSQCPSCNALIPQTKQQPISTFPQQLQTLPKKSMVIVFVFGCLASGLAQIYLGQVAKGILLVSLLCVLNIFQTIFQSAPQTSLTVLWPLFIQGLFRSILLIDAILLCKKMNAGHTIRKWEWF